MEQVLQRPSKKENRVSKKVQHCKPNKHDQKEEANTSEVSKIDIQNVVDNLENTVTNNLNEEAACKEDISGNKSDSEAKLENIDDLNIPKTGSEIAVEQEKLSDKHTPTFEESKGTSKDDKVFELGTILNENKQILNTISLNEVQNNIFKSKNEPKTCKLKINTLNDIRPYTENQLAAFYTNTELNVIDSFTEQYIEAELRGLAIKKHPLYEYLSSYLHVREKIMENKLELDQLRKEYRELQGQLWSVNSKTVSAKGECQDGNTVVASHSYDKATFHRSVYQSIFRILTKIQQCTFEHHVLYSYSAEDLRLQVR
ncbi:hypothetical protein HHI36_009669 [Cryptolaemus montrouzieri]|uniref:Uncharacterized protein n=1 Tax=Cryptolaemus montrouzieri TaxID=559131 RepID=A0ABD2MGI2_9CUCU